MFPCVRGFWGAYHGREAKACRSRVRCGVHRLDEERAHFVGIVCWRRLILEWHALATSGAGRKSLQNLQAAKIYKKHVPEATSDAAVYLFR